MGIQWSCERDLAKLAYNVEKKAVAIQTTDTYTDNITKIRLKVVWEKTQLSIESFIIEFSIWDIRFALDSLFFQVAWAENMKAFRIPLVLLSDKKKNRVNMCHKT